MEQILPPDDYEGKVHFPMCIYYPGRSVMVQDETELANAEAGWAYNPEGPWSSEPAPTSLEPAPSSEPPKKAKK